MSIVAVIPARGGSKGIPRKNLVRIAGRSLIAYTIEAARNAASVDRVLISTDDNEIADVARELGAEVPFLRPPELADDKAPMLGVLRHALAWLESQGVAVEAVVLLQPTSPLRTACHVEEAIALFRSAPASSIISVVEVPHQFNPVSLMKLTDQGTLAPFLGDKVIITRRQDKPKAYARNGPAVLICHPDTLRSGELYGTNCVPYFMSKEDSLDIDTQHDLILAERVLLSRRS
jgi:CMP-N,N'-diacetyllegionaminic acid synthase